MMSTDDYFKLFDLMTKMGCEVELIMRTASHCSFGEEIGRAFMLAWIDTYLPLESQRSEHEYMSRGANE